MKCAFKGVLLLLTCAACAAGASEPSLYYFNHGAEQYIRDDREAAVKWVDEGLLLYPDDARLVELKRLLEQQNQPNPQSSPEQQPQDGSNQDQQQNPDPDNQPAEPDPAPEEPPSQQDENQADQPASAMTPEEAARMLDAMRDKEQVDRARMAADRIQRESRNLTPVEKDW
jgi:hypothetical protein